MKIRLEIDVDEESMEDDDLTPFEARNKIAEVRREILATLSDSGRWTVERGQAGIYFLASSDKAEEASMGFSVKEQ